MEECIKGGGGNRTGLFGRRAIRKEVFQSCNNAVRRLGEGTRGPRQAQWSKGGKEPGGTNIGLTYSVPCPRVQEV